MMFSVASFKRALGKVHKQIVREGKGARLQDKLHAMPCHDKSERHNHNMTSTNVSVCRSFLKVFRSVIEI